MRSMTIEDLRSREFIGWAVRAILDIDEARESLQTLIKSVPGLKMVLIGVEVSDCSFWFAITLPQKPVLVWFSPRTGEWWIIRENSRKRFDTVDDLVLSLGLDPKQIRE